MKQKETAYKRIPGRGRRRGKGEALAIISSYSKLYIAKDHLLCIDKRFCSETYKRFYFKDIQSLAYFKTNRWLFNLLAIGSIFILFLIIILLIDATELQIFMGGFALLVLILLIKEYFLGPTCRFFIKTAVQTEELPSLDRIRNVRKGRPIILSAIHAKQGSINSEIVTNWENQAEILPFSTPVNNSYSKLKSKKKLEEIAYDGKTHIILSAIVLFFSLLLAINIFINNLFIFLLVIILGFLCFIFAVFALIKQSEYKITRTIKAITISILSYQSLAFFVAFIYFYVILLTVFIKRDLHFQGEIFSYFGNQIVYQTVFRYYFHLTLFGLGLGFGTALLVFSLKLRRNYYNQKKDVPT